MRDVTVARNYAETLFELARRDGNISEFEGGISAVARLIDESTEVREFIETPRISSAEKKSTLEKAVGGRVPPLLMNFLKVVIDKRRQRLIRGIAEQFRALVDEDANVTHVDVTVAHPLEGPAVEEVARQLSRALGKTAIPHVRVRPEILGGVVIRTGDTIYDGSVRRQIEGMRRTLIAAELPAPAGE